MLIDTRYFGEIDMDEKKIARINELYHKSKAEGLTEAERKDSVRFGE